METLRTLPGDDVRQILWRYSDRYELQMIVQSARSVARGPVARLVAEGGRNTHDWTEKKNDLLKAFDESGVTAVFMDPEQGGFVEGPKNLVLSLVAFELAWVDAGAATSSLAGNLALSPIHERGTKEQRDEYLRRCAPAAPGEDRKPARGAFGLTEPLPYVGVDAGMLGGKVRIVDWPEGGEPTLQVEKRGRFITNMDFADFVTAAVDTDDPRIKGTCMVILESTDPGVFDRGSPTLKLVHQLSSTRDPVLSLQVPASRIIGGYAVKDGVILPNQSHGEVIEAVFRRTRVPVSLMSAAKLLSAVEPVIRYHRQRFRGGDASSPGSPRYNLGLQQKEDTVHRLVDIWATGEAAASLGFAAARLFDQFDPLEKVVQEYFRSQQLTGRAQLRAMRAAQKDAIEYVRLAAAPEQERDQERFAELHSNDLVRYLVMDSAANVLCPACKLWNTGHGANMMREAVSLVGGYGITEDCPGFLGQKWMDAQLEATYEGPEAVQRRQLTITMTNEVFLEQYRHWMGEMRRIASEKPGTGACVLASAMALWLWTVEHLQESKDANGNAIYHPQRQGVTFPLADALSWLLASRQQILDVLELEEKGPLNPVIAEGIQGLVSFMSDLCHVQAARSAGEASRICAELVYGYRGHTAAEGAAPGTCCKPGRLEAAESIACGGNPVQHTGQCVAFDGMDEFVQLRNLVEGSLVGSRLAKDRAADAVTRVMIPEALDYPV